MFYRLRIDSNISSILKDCGFISSKTQLKFWPIGATEEAVVYGEANGFTAAMTAVIAVSEVVSKYREIGMISDDDAMRLINYVGNYASKKGINYTDVLINKASNRFELTCI